MSYWRLLITNTFLDWQVDLSKSDLLNEYEYWMKTDSKLAAVVDDLDQFTAANVERWSALKEQHTSTNTMNVLSSLIGDFEEKQNRLYRASFEAKENAHLLATHRYFLEVYVYAFLMVLE